MSSALAIASVSLVLVDLLNNGLIDHDVGNTLGGSVKVSAMPPDRVLPATGTEPSQLNLFLYRVAPNAALRNTGLPARDGHGRRVSNPPLALDLHYLLTAYGERDFHAEILLGYAMQLLHETPVLTRAAIATALAVPSPTGPAGTLPAALADLSKSGLADQLEQIKLTLVPLSTEEISKLWTALQSHYRSTAAYEASVVLIESKFPVSTPLPVRAPRVYARPFRRLRLERVRAATGEREPILANSTLLIQGSGLRGELTRVRLAGQEIDPGASAVTDTEIRLPLGPLDTAAGVQAVQVVHRTLMGEPPAPHVGAESNVGTFVIAPQITSSITRTTTATAGLHKGTLGFTVLPGVRRGQRLAIVLNQLPAAAADEVPLTIGLAPTVVQADATDLIVPVEGIPAGSYLVRIQVDGAESPLTTDPAGGRFTGPTAVFP